MSSIPEHLRYVESHEWIHPQADGTVLVGITDHAQIALGDVVFVELPQPGTQLTAGDQAGVVESVKAASDIYAPLAGEVVESNAELADAPERINAAPYESWFFRLRPSNPDALEQLLDAAAYARVCEQA